MKTLQTEVEITHWETYEKIFLSGGTHPNKTLCNGHNIPRDG